MAQEFNIKQHDLEPPLIVACLDDGDPVDLTTAVSARLLMRNLLAGLKVDAVCEILNQTTYLGMVRYIWVADDTDTVGVFNAEIEIIWPGGRPQTFPAGKGAARYFKVNVNNDLTD